MDLSLISVALAATSPELSVKIQVPKRGRHYVTSAGAACFARQIALIPDLVRYKDEHEIADHDELEICDSHGKVYMKSHSLRTSVLSGSLMYTHR
jgi:hypothetical protein